jgi:hypothetical protein
MKFVLAPARLWILLLIICLIAVSALAENNVLGLFYDTSASIDEIDVSPNSLHSLYLVLINPVNEEFGGGGTRDVDYVWGFECAIEAPSGDILMDVTFPAQAINLGDTESIIAGFATAVRVSSQQAVTLATFSVLTMGNSPEGYRLVPTSPSSHANTMAYVDYDDPDDAIVDMSPISGSHDKPVFTFGDYTIELNAKWGAVKSLYR